MCMCILFSRWCWFLSVCFVVLPKYSFWWFKQNFGMKDIADNSSAVYAHGYHRNRQREKASITKKFFFFWLLLPFIIRIDGVCCLLLLLLLLGESIFFFVCHPFIYLHPTPIFFLTRSIRQTNKLVSLCYMWNMVSWWWKCGSNKIIIKPCVCLFVWWWWWVFFRSMLLCQCYFNQTSWLFVSRSVDWYFSTFN